MRTTVDVFALFHNAISAAAYETNKRIGVLGASRGFCPMKASVFFDAHC